MVTNESEESAPLSVEFKEAQKAFNLLNKEAKGIQKQWVELRKDVRTGTTTKEQSNELGKKLHARSDEIALEMFRLTEKMRATK